MKKQFFTEKEVAEMGIRAIQSLRNDRWAGRGLPFFKIGKSVRYSVKDIREFLQKGKIEPNRRSG